MKSRIVCLLFLGCSVFASADDSESESKLFRALGWGVWATSAGDAASTDVALILHPGILYEANPLQRNRYVRWGSHVALPVAVNRTTAYLYRDGKTKTAILVRVAVVVAMGSMVVSNTRKSLR